MFDGIAPDHLISSNDSAIRTNFEPATSGLRFDNSGTGTQDDMVGIATGPKVLAVCNEAQSDTSGKAITNLTFCLGTRRCTSALSPGVLFQGEPASEDMLDLNTAEHQPSAKAQ